jgi:hypothetical protein
MTYAIFTPKQSVAPLLKGAKKTVSKSSLGVFFVSPIVIGIAVLLLDAIVNGEFLVFAPAGSG